MKILKTVSAVALAISATYLTGCAGSADSAGGNNGGNQSNAGSTATILPYGDVAYTLEGHYLKVIDLAQTPPSLHKTMLLEFPETLFISNNHLYIGGEVGVDIFNIEDPYTPVKASTYEHLRACDPIIVHDDIGYVTLRSGLHNRCRLQGKNRLEVVDMSNPTAPELIEVFAMANPYGLAKIDDRLAICEEAFGLSLVNVADTNNIRQTANYPNINCFDLINQESSLIATATDGIYQFSVEPNTITEISRIPVGENTTSPSSSASNE